MSLMKMTFEKNITIDAKPDSDFYSSVWTRNICFNASQ